MWNDDKGTLLPAPNLPGFRHSGGSEFCKCIQGPTIRCKVLVKTLDSKHLGMWTASPPHDTLDTPGKKSQIRTWSRTNLTKQKNSGEFSPLYSWTDLHNPKYISGSDTSRVWKVRISTRKPLPKVESCGGQNVKQVNVEPIRIGNTWSHQLKNHYQWSMGLSSTWKFHDLWSQNAGSASKPWESQKVSIYFNPIKNHHWKSCNGFARKIHPMVWGVASANFRGERKKSYQQKNDRSSRTGTGPLGPSIIPAQLR